jgi:uncharacterized protein
MITGFGPDFLAARAASQYQARSGQSWLWVIGMLVAQLLVLAALQGLFGVLAHLALFGTMPDLSRADSAGLTQFSKASIVGLTPAAVLTALFCWRSAHWGNAKGETGMPLQQARLGTGGWVVLVAGFVATMWIVFIVTFAVLGIDPATYAPVDGIDGKTSQSGLVEKTLAELAREPLLFALALPGVVLAVPLAEEVMFRGALFAKLRHSWFGQIGAVTITAALWSLIHGGAAPWLFVGLIFIMGLVLGVLLLRFGSLWVTVAAHAAWNGFSSLSILGIATGA